MNKLKIFFLLALVLVLLAAPAGAEIAEPHFVIYGRATVDGTPLPAGEVIRLEVLGEVLASYTMRSNPDLGELYALRVPLDTVGAREPGFARSGDGAQIYFGNGNQLAAIVVVGAAGTTKALDLDPSALVSGIIAGDLSVVEGDSGIATVQLPIRITQVSPVNVEVDFITRNGTASSASDYTPRLGRAIVPAGQLQTTIALQISGDTTIESDEDFFVDLSAPLNGVLLDPEGRVVILDDDTPPAISIGDLTANEPNPGAVQQVTFEVQLSHVWDAVVSVNYAAFSPPGGAINGSDFNLNPGTLSFAPGQVTRQITVNILGDLLDENDEVFEVRLTNPTGATVADGTGVGTITDYVRILRFLEEHENGVAVSGPAPGLAGAFDVALSPDGTNLYVAGRASDAIAVFTRDTDGTLTHLVTYKNGENGVSGLNGIEAVRVSSDGLKVFAASFDDNAVASFLRQPDGSLVFADAEFDGVLDPESGRTVNGLFGASGLAEAVGMQPGDSDHLYVTGLLDNAVAVFTIAANGKLEYETAAIDGVLGANGLAQAAAITIAPNGTDVYVAGYSDDSVALFTRNPSDGFLTFRQILVDGAGGVFGLDGAIDVALSADGELLYAAGQNSNAVVTFVRNPANGFLTFVGSVVDEINGVDGLKLVTSLAFSHDPQFGDFLYASSYGDNAVAIFERQANGTLTFLEQVRDGVGGADGLAGANALVASADDQNVYVVGSTESKLAVFERDIVPPATLPTLFSTSHSLGVPSNLGTLSFEWANASDQGYGLAEYWLLIDTTTNTPAPAGPPSLRVPHGADPHSASVPSPEDSDHLYLHLTACDLIGNCSPNHLGPFVVDTTRPGQAPSLASASHGTPNSEPRIRTSWLPAQDPLAPSGYASGLAGYRGQFLATAAPTCAGGAPLGVAETSLRSNVLAVGNWYFHLCSVDAVGNESIAAVLGPLTILPDTTPPQVQAIDSVARSADGRISEGEELDGAITQWIAHFSESVQIADAGNVANFKLFEPGSNGVIDSTTCAGPTSDDVAVPLASATYDDTSKTTVLRLPAGVSLGGGAQRALVCATIRDLRDNALGGGVDHVLSFLVPSNSLFNPNFDSDLAGWTLSHPGATWTSADADGAPSSGSASTRVTDQEESAEQCLEAAALASLGDFAGLRGRVRLTDHSATPVAVRAELTFYPGAGCLGTELQSANSLPIVGDSGGAWLDLGLDAAIPLGAQSMRVRFKATPTDIAADSDIEIDRTLLLRSVMFADGFETGDTSGWSLTQP